MFHICPFYCSKKSGRPKQQRRRNKRLFFSWSSFVRFLRIEIHPENLLDGALLYREKVFPPWFTCFYMVVFHDDRDVVRIICISRYFQGITRDIHFYFVPFPGQGKREVPPSERQVRFEDHRIWVGVITSKAHECRFPQYAVTCEVHAQCAVGTRKIS